MNIDYHKRLIRSIAISFYRPVKMKTRRRWCCASLMNYLPCCIFFCGSYHQQFLLIGAHDVVINVITDDRIY